MARDRDDDRRSSRDEDRSFRYERRSADDMKRRASEKSGNFSSFIKGDFKKYKMRDGKNMIRILPGNYQNKNGKHYALTIHLNYKIGADNQTFLSISEMKGEKDPLAEARKEAQRDGDKELAKALTPQKRSLMWVIDRLDEEEGPQLLDCPFGVDTDFVNLAIDEDTKEVIYVDDPVEGADIRFYKEPGKPFPKYPAAKMKIMPAGPLSEDKGLQKEWLAFIKDNPVPDCLQFYDYGHIQEAFDGVIGTYDDGKGKPKDDDDDEKPARKPRRDDDVDVKPARKPARDEDDDESERDPKPARRSRQQLEDDEDDDDEKPRGKKSSHDEDEDEADDEAEPKANARPSIRERLAARRSKSTDDDD